MGMQQGVGFVSCSVREARDSFSKLRRRAAGGEEILIAPENAEGEAGSVSLVPTWLLDKLMPGATDWTVVTLGEPGYPVSRWSREGGAVREHAGAERSDAYVL